jgi:hypothetical protein
LFIVRLDDKSEGGIDMKIAFFLFHFI